MKSVSKRIMLLALFFFMAAFAAQADACTVVMAGKKDTANGEVLVFYSCDR